jgi:UPF0176 protein
MSVTVTAFYKFVAIADPPALREQLLERARGLDIKGTILLAPEGINATIAGPDAGIRAMLVHLRADPRFADLVSKESCADAVPFRRLKVKVKREIVTLRRPEADPSRRVGTYVQPEHWNALIADPDVVVIDTRNAYEVAIGTFRGALDPATRAFSEFPDFVAASLDPARHRRVAMFCTGGIRCEKASAYLLSQGFPEVYHLEGGILKYLETVPPDESLWQGECFVFDERVALEHGVKPGAYVLCKRCGFPVAAGEGSDCTRCSGRDELEPRDRPDEKREEDHAPGRGRLAEVENADGRRAERAEPAPDRIGCPERDRRRGLGDAREAEPGERQDQHGRPESREAVRVADGGGEGDLEAARKHQIEPAQSRLHVTDQR